MTWAERIVGFLLLLLVVIPPSLLPALRLASPHFAVSVSYFNGGWAGGIDPWGSPWAVSVALKPSARVAMSVGPNRRYEGGRGDDIEVVYLPSTRSWATVVRAVRSISVLGIASLLACVAAARVFVWDRSRRKIGASGPEGDQRHERLRSAAAIGSSLLVPVFGAWLLVSDRLEDLRAIGILDTWHGVLPLPISVAGTTAGCFLAIAWTLQAALLTAQASDPSPG